MTNRGWRSPRTRTFRSTTQAGLDVIPGLTNPRAEPALQKPPKDWLMYKFLLCARYLRTRYIALASIISVMLGVATMIVVNSVMAGFSTEMRSRIHGILADMVLESISMGGQ